MKGAKPQLRNDAKAVGNVAPPRWMAKEAKTEWQRVMPILAERRILTVADLGSLENYCVAIGTVRQMERHLRRHGHVFETFKETSEGDAVCLGMKRNPAVGIQSDAMTRARLLAAELGLTPVSRSRPAIREDDPEDEDDPLNLS